MQVKEIIIPYSCSDEFRIYPLGDAHDGTKHFAEKKFIEKVKEIKSDKRNLWIDMADSCEFIVPGDPRFDAGVIADWLKKDDDDLAEEQVDHYVSLVEPIASQCIGRLKGNHELTIHKHNHVNVQKHLCKKLKIDDLDYSAFLKFIFKRKGSTESHAYTGFFTHGAGGAITAGAKMLRLQRLMDNFDADIIASGHVHDILTYSKPYMTLDASNQVKQRVKVGAMTGCWFRTYTQGVPSSYGEQKNYPPVAIGCPVFTINPHKAILRVEG